MRDNCPKSGIRRKLFLIIFEADSKAGQLFDLCLLWSILLSILCVILDSEPWVVQRIPKILFAVEWFFTILFSIEYCLRVYVSRNPAKYIFSFFGVIDLLSTIPTYLSLFVPGSQYFLVLRVLRLLRVFRVLKLVRYLKESEILLKAIKASQVKITVFIGAVLSVVLIIGTMMHLIEGDESGFSSIPKGMYWAIVTITTVGYGDIVPMTTAGKFLASILMIVGYGVLAVPTGIVSAEIVQQRRDLASCGKCRHQCSEGDNYCPKCGEELPREAPPLTPS